MIEVILLTILLILTLIWGHYFVRGMHGMTPFYPSRFKHLKKVLDELDIDPADKTFVDLGSGDGRIVNGAVNYGFKKAIGYELNPFLTLLSNAFRLILGNKNVVEFRREDFDTADLSDADVVFVYLFPKYMRNLEKKFADEMRPGSMVISKAFSLQSMEPVREVGEYKVYMI